MENLDKKQYFLDGIGVLFIGAFSLGYVLFYNFFAELHIQISFLNFPIFAGEILLFICLFLFLAKYRNNLPKLTRWHYAIIGYFIFVAIKALYGYVKWGPLALRHSALLYYPSFVVFGYVFYRRKFFSVKMVCFLVISIICVFIYRKFYEYWVLTLAFLGFIFIKSFPHGRTKILMFLLFFACIPYQGFFQTSRMMIVSNFVVGVYLAIMLFLILEGNKKFKVAVATVVVGVVLLGLFKFSNHSALRSIVNFKRMEKVFSDGDRKIKASIGHYNAEERREVKLYNPDRAVDAQPKVVVSKEVRKRIEMAFVQLAEEGQEFHKRQNKEKMEMVSIGQSKEGMPPVSVEKIKEPAFYNDNAVFRLFIWRDMLVNLANEKPIFGFDFGKPFRSKSLEILHWGDGDWARDGWIAPHNSYLHIIYRTGIIGLLLIVSLLTILFRMIQRFIAIKSLTGILLSGIIINWFVAANFLLTFELPYTAIPIWTIYGMTFAYYHEVKEKNTAF